MPAVLVEAGFVSNTNEAKMLKTKKNIDNRLQMEYIKV